MAVKATGFIQGIGTSSGNAASTIDVIIDFVISDNTSTQGCSQGTTILKCDISQTDANITTNLRTSLAAYINGLYPMSPALQVADVRGCNL